MKKNFVLKIIFSTLLIVASFPVIVLADEKTDIEQKILEQEKKLEDLDNQKNNAEDQLSLINQNINSIQEKAKKLENEQILISSDTKSLNIEIDEITKRIEKRNSTIQKQVRSFQLEKKNGNMLNILLSSDSISDAVNKVNAANRIVKANKELLEEQEIDKKTLNNKIESFEKKNKQLHVTLQELEKKKQELENQQIQQQILLNKIAFSKETEISKKRAFEETQNEFIAKQEELKLLEDKLNKNNTSDIKGMVDGILFTTNKELKSPLHGQDIVKEAKKYIGVPYVWGGTTPNGFDCSGLVQYVFAKNNILLPRVTTSQEYIGEMIGLNQLEPGDLVFFGKRGETDHVGIYIGNGKYIQAPEPGDFVKITSISAFTPSFGVRVNS